MAVLIPRRLFTVPKARVIERNDTSATLQIDGLVCSICANRVRSSLRRLDGVAGADCNLNSGRATVTLTDPKLDPAILSGAVESVAILTPVRRWLAALAQRTRQ